MVRCVFIGRFQPFHKGHHRVIDENRDEFESFTVVVGSASKEGEEDNPLSFEERKDMIQECFPGIEIVGLEDETRDEEGNRRWIQKLEKKLDPDRVITNNSLVEQLVEKYTDAELIEQDLYERSIYAGTEIRRRIRSGEEWRYLVPECCLEILEDKLEKIRESGIEYEFEPGWKKENAYHDTYEK